MESERWGDRPSHHVRAQPSGCITGDRPSRKDPDRGRGGEGAGGEPGPSRTALGGGPADGEGHPRRGAAGRAGGGGLQLEALLAVRLPKNPGLPQPASSTDTPAGNRVS